MDRMDVNYFVTSNAWTDTERNLADCIGLKLIEANAVVIDLLAKEIKQSDFTLEEIRAVIDTDGQRFLNFCRRYYQMASKTADKEEWNKFEGDQQRRKKHDVQELGICQGFMMTYALQFLYAKSKPKLLLEFLKRRRIPQAKKFAADVLKLYATFERS